MKMACIRYLNDIIQQMYSLKMAIHVPLWQKQYHSDIHLS